MNKILLLSIWMLLLSHIAKSQNKAIVKGIVKDSLTKTAQEYATVAIVNTKDTSLISYTITDKTGGFKLSGIPTDKSTKLIISYIGFDTKRILLQLKGGQELNLGEIFITGKILNEVVIQGERSPVVMKKDTIEFNTEAFKTRPNAVVEDLLRLLPGVQVNNDGSILVNGKDVSKLLIDGKRFFGNDPKVATRNLDADMIDQIQVYDDREDDPDHKQSDNDTKKIINLKMKSKIKKSTLGKIHGGLGTRDRYEIGGMISSFRDTLQVSVIGLSNNLNSTGFSVNELYSMGGFDRSGGGQYYDGTFGGNNWGGGLQKVISGGLNLNNDYPTLKTNFNYFYTNTKTINRTTALQEQSLDNTVLTSSSLSNSDRNSQRNAFGGLIEWNVDTLSKLKYEPKFEFKPERNTYVSNDFSFNTQIPKLNESGNNNRENTFNRAFSHNLNYYRRFSRKGESLTINHSLSLSNNQTEGFNYSNLVSFVNTADSKLFDRFLDNGNNDNLVALALTYNYPLSKKLTAELFSNSRYLIKTDQSFTYENNAQNGKYDQLLSNQSSDLHRLGFIQNIKPQLSYQLSDKLTIKIGLDGEFQYINNKFNAGIKDIPQHFYKFFPLLKIMGSGYALDYYEYLDHPQIAQMQPIAREYSPLYKIIGNPNLRPKHLRIINGSYYKYNYATQFNTYVYSQATFSENNIVSRTTVDELGNTTSSYVNRSGGFDLNINASVSKQFKKSQKWQIGLNTNLYTNSRSGAFFLNGLEGKQFYYSIVTGQGISFNYNSLVTLNAKYDLSASITKYREVDFKSVSTLTHTIGSDVNLRLPKKIIIDAKYGYNFNPQIPQGFPKTSHILNIATSLLMLKKDRGQLKVSVYDLLNQNISVNRYAYNNSIYTSDQLILKRYFMINYQYKLNIYKSK
jgi:hypothetical protein